jgi:hypothetical protein
MLEFSLPEGLLDGDPPYWFAVIDPGNFHPPPYDGTRKGATGAEPRILVLEPGGEMDAFVSQYAGNLGYITDSWYPTREAALEDAVSVFGELLGPWVPVPVGESDPEAFILRTAGAKKP